MLVEGVMNEQSCLTKEKNLDLARISFLVLFDSLLNLCVLLGPSVVAFLRAPETHGRV